ncbi:sensor histidine kinase [Defluviimonas salinarum]|uniref:histidine kinase n=1 Tax=Defluviimonas salinarum TaxID=2992147 RepID=A0ABT3J7V9_9RHOB|nr:ATP-binding protein [Defluviimonas salinarum]MCW3783767.1 histidine kinase [Defluviimonas salinarum]
MPRSILSWSDRSLAAQFALAGGVVMVLSMLLIGRVVAARIEESVVRNSALATSQYMDSIISPLSQDIAEADTLPPGARRALDEIFTNTPLGERVASFKLWKPGGLVVEATDKTIVGRRFEVTDSLARAFAGEVRAEFQNLSDEEDRGENALGLPLLEIYSPVREVWSGEVIGVAEFYEVATGLERDLAEATRNSWISVALVFVAIGGVLFLIVLRGSRTIDRQRAALTRQLGELEALSTRNTALRERVQQAAARASAANDRALRRIGADLHDGPAQLLSFAALRLDALRGQLAETGEIDAVERAVKDAIREVRGISKGLSHPDIEDRGPYEIVTGVAEAHEARTGTKVEVTCDLREGFVLSQAEKICLYRFVQEGLNNAWRYGSGRGQEIRLDCRDGRLVLWVRDAGPGFPPEGAERHETEDFSGIGLAGLRDRVESLGGSFTAGNRADGAGAEIGMELDMRGA